MSTPADDVGVVLTTNHRSTHPGVSVVWPATITGSTSVTPSRRSRRKKPPTLELIVVDDASTDGTESVVREFAAHTAFASPMCGCPRHAGKAGDRIGVSSWPTVSSSPLPMPIVSPIPDGWSERWRIRPAVRHWGWSRAGPSAASAPGDVHPFHRDPSFRRFLSTSNIVYRRTAIGGIALTRLASTGKTQTSAFGPVGRLGRRLRPRCHRVSPGRAAVGSHVAHVAESAM